MRKSTPLGSPARLSSLRCAQGQALSTAKDLRSAQREILRCAQDDMGAAKDDMGAAKDLRSAQRQILRCAQDDMGAAMDDMAGGSLRLWGRSLRSTWWGIYIASMMTADYDGKNMRIALITLGSEGDVRPFIALGLGLQAAGHDVLLVTHTPFEPLIHSRGLACFPVGNDPRDVLENEMGQTWLDTGNNALRFFRQFSRIADSLIQQYMLECWNACQGSEAIVFSTIGLAVGYPIAEKLGVPFGMAAPYPLTPTHAFRSPYFPALPASLPFSGFYNHLTHVLSMQIFWQLVRPAVNKARREVLNLPSLSPNWPLSEMRRGRFTLLYCYSPSIVPPASDWSSWNHVTGYWFLDRQAEWQPPPDLVDFLASGPPPVYIGFGSMNSHRPEEVTEMVLQALARSKQRGILLTGWGGLSNADLPDNMFKIDSIPHDWLFPQMAAVVHHGGSGTTAASMRAGIPTVVIPFFGDQHFWGQRIFALGAGPRPIPRKRLSVEQLAAAIQAAACDEVMCTRSAALGECIRKEDGVTQAVEVLHRHLHITG